MKRSTSDLITIDDHLRLFLFGLSCVLQQDLTTREVDRVFSDAMGNQAVAREYLLCDTKRARVAGFVDDHEPETIMITVETRGDIGPVMKWLLENVRCEVRRRVEGCEQIG
jgi:hypothetical protein